MPMCDAYIPTGALERAAERTLIAKVSDILVSHEVRRIFDLMEDPHEVEDSLVRARSLAWTFVHRCDTYVAGAVPDVPYYKFIVSVPEGQLDDEFIPAVNRDILQALKEAEAGAWPNLGGRLWIFVREVPDGTWGAHGLSPHLNEIIDFISPGWGRVAVDRWNEKRAAEAAALVELAGKARVSS